MASNDIEYLDKMIWAYEAFLGDVESKLKRDKSIKDLCSALIKRKIMNTAHSAFQEIKKSVFAANDSQNRTVEFYRQATKNIEERVDDQILRYKLNHAEKMYFHQSYFRAVQPLYDFNSNLKLFENQKHSEKTRKIPSKFEELFLDSKNVNPAINILKELDPPILSPENAVINGPKGTFCVWINELSKQGIIKHFADRKVYSELLSKYINDFSIDESMFGRHHKTAENRYRTDIKTMVSQIKLAQTSQKGKLGI